MYVGTLFSLRSNLGKITAHLKLEATLVRTNNGCKRIQSKNQHINQKSKMKAKSIWSSA